MPVDSPKEMRSAWQRRPAIYGRKNSEEIRLSPVKFS
jgi:hypothetical protein